MTRVVLLAVPVKDGVVLSDGDAGEFNVTLGAAASAVNITGETVAESAISSRPIARPAATLTSRMALNTLVTVPPSMFQSAGESQRRPRNSTMRAITYKSLMTQFGGGQLRPP